MIHALSLSLSPLDTNEPKAAPSESRQIARLFTARDSAIARSSVPLGLRNRYSRQRAAASDKPSSVARTIARIQPEPRQRPGHPPVVVVVVVVVVVSFDANPDLNSPLPFPREEQTRAVRERERERERISLVLATFSRVCTHRGARANTRTRGGGEAHEKWIQLATQATRQ